MNRSEPNWSSLSPNDLIDWVVENNANLLELPSVGDRDDDDELLSLRGEWESAAGEIWRFWGDRTAPNQG